MNRCCICGKTAEYYKTLYDDRYGYSGLFQLRKCNECGHKSLRETLAPESLSRLYTRYYPRSTYSPDEFRPHREAHGFQAWLQGERSFAFRWVPKNVRVLDIGCGFGEAVGYHEERGCDAHGVELDENIRCIADKFGYKIRVGAFDANNYEPGFFDYVTMDQVIEHVINPVESLRDIASVLRPGGVLILGTPNSNGWGARTFGDRWIHWHAPYHLHLFSRKSMALAAEQSGLALTDVRTLTHSDWLHFQWVHLLTRPRMGQPSPFWAPNIQRTFIQKGIMTAMLCIHLTKIDHVITRLFDALDMGDNYLFFLRKVGLTLN